MIKAVALKKVVAKGSWVISVSPGFPVIKDALGTPDEFSQVLKYIKELLPKVKFKAKLVNRKVDLDFEDQKTAEDSSYLLHKNGYKTTRIF